MTGKPTTGEARIHLRTDAARLYLAGGTIQSVADDIGRSYGCTRTLLLEAGVTLRGHGASLRKTRRR